MRFDTDVKKLVSAAFYQKNDVFLRVDLPDIKEFADSDIKTAVFMPGAFCGEDEFLFSDVSKQLPAAAFAETCSFLAADIRYLNNPLFCDFIKKCGFRRFAVVFAECADYGEYGYRESFFRLSELKSESEVFIQIVALFSPTEHDFDAFMRFFGCDSAVYAGEIKDNIIKVTEAPSPSAKFYRVAAEAEKYAGRSICIFFNSRSELRDFSVFLNNRGTPHVLLDGSLSYDNRKRILSEFSCGEFPILLATKSLIPEIPFVKADRCLFCGVPFSLSHLSRCSAIVNYGCVHIFFCQDDFIRNSRIISSFSQITGDSSIYEKRMKSLSEIKDLLKEGQ